MYLSYIAFERKRGLGLNIMSSEMVSGATSMFAKILIVPLFSGLLTDKIRALKLSKSKPDTK